MGFLNGANNWLEGAMGTGMGLANNWQGGYTPPDWQATAGAITGPAAYNLNVSGTGINDMISGANQPSLGQNLNYFTQNLPQMAYNFGGYSNPLTQQAASGLGGFGQGALNSFAQQMGTLGPGVSTSGGISNNLIGNLGASNYNQYMQGAAMNAAAGGGMTPTLSMLMNPIQGIIGRQGNNAQSQALMAGGNPFLASGGQTQLSQGLANQGMNLFNQQALMNPAQAAGLARNQAATQWQQQAQQAEQQALARGGGAGSTVANGLQNQGMADFANQAAQGISGAGNTALQNQQQLQLQQQLGGGQLAQGAGGLQNNMLGTAGGLTGQSGQLANNMFLQGMGLSPTMQNAATNYLNAYLGGGASGAQNQLGMLGAGSNLQNNLMGYQTAMGGLGNTAMNNLFTQALGAGQLDNARMQTLTNAMNQGYGQQNQYLSNLSNLWASQMNPLTAIAGQQANMGQSGLSSLAQMLAGGMGAAGSTGSQFLNNVLGIAGSIGGAFAK